MGYRSEGKSKGSKKRGGLLGAAGKAFGGAMEMLQLPFQTVAGVGHALGGVATGDTKSIKEGLKHTAGELGSLGLAKGNWDFAQAAGRWEGDKLVGAKLPKGVNTALTIGLDPLNFMVAGKGAQATKGVKALAGMTGKAEKAVSAGLRTGAVDLSKGSALRGQLVENLMAGGTTAKKAEKIAKMTSQRGAGGLALRVPGTELSKVYVAPETLSKVGKGVSAATERVGLAKPLAKAGEAVKSTFSARHALREGLQDTELADQIYDELGVSAARVMAADDDLLHELAAARQQTGRKTITSEDAADLLYSIEADDIDMLDPDLLPLRQVIVRNRDQMDARQVAADLFGNRAAETRATRKVDKAADKLVDKRADFDDAAAEAKRLQKELQKAEGELRAATEKKGIAKQALRQRVAKARAESQKAEAAVKRARAEFVSGAKPELYEDITTFRSPEEVMEAQHRMNEVGNEVWEMRDDIAALERTIAEAHATTVNIDDIRVGDTILGYSGEPKVVSEILDNVRGRTVVNFEDGGQIFETPGTMVKSPGKPTAASKKVVKEAEAKLKPLLEKRDALQAEMDAIDTRLANANQGHGILPQETMEWDPFQADVWRMSLTPEQLATDGTYQVDPGMFAAVRDGRVAGIMHIDDFGIEIGSHPQYHGTGIGREMKDAAKAAGFDPDGLAGTTGFTPMGAQSAANRRAHQAADVIDYSEMPKPFKMSQERFVKSTKELQKRVAAAEKVSDPADWTAAERAAYDAGDMVEFSRLRGYTEAEIADFQELMRRIDLGPDYNYKFLDTNADAVDLDDIYLEHVRRMDAEGPGTSKLQAAADKAQTDYDTLVSEVDALKKKVSELRHGKPGNKAEGVKRQKGLNEALKTMARKQAKLSSAKAEMKKAAKNLAAAQESNAGLRENYMQRLPTDELADAAAGPRGNMRSQFTSEVGSIPGSLSQRAERARSWFPEMPARTLNYLKEAVDKGTDIRMLLTQDPLVTKFVKNLDPKQLEEMAAGFEEMAKAMPEGPMYTEDAILSFLNRSTMGERAIQAKESVDRLADLTDANGKRILAIGDTIPQQLPEGWSKATLPHIGEIAAPDALINEIAKLTGMAGKGDWAEKVFKAVEAWGRFWRTQATVGLMGALPFGMRNGRSNIHLISAAGDHNPDDVVKAMMEMKKFEDKVRKIVGAKRMHLRPGAAKYTGELSGDIVERGLDDVLRENLTEAEYDFFRAMQREGITTKGFFDVDFTGGIKGKAAEVMGQPTPARGGIAGRVVKDVLGSTGKVAREGRNFNQAIETNARMASFLLEFQRHGNYRDAAIATKKVLFDYSELTEVEKKLLKNVIPFYTFMRKNLPLQLESIATNPIRTVMPEKLGSAMMESLDDEAPDYQKEAGSHVIPKAFPLIGGLVVTPDRPVHAAYETLTPLTMLARGRGREAAGSAANTFSGPQLEGLRALSEIATGKDMFTRGNVQPGAREGLTRLVGSQLPSLSRLPRVAGVRSVTNRQAKPTEAEVLRILAGIRSTRNQ